MKTFEYCAAIRTLGTAGEKYQVLLDSLDRQTIKPKKILVYIPYGYKLPKETIGWEEYVRCPKGMITQRSLSFDEIDTEYILFCDDDLWLANDFVQEMFKGLVENKGDCIAPDVFLPQKMSMKEKFKKAILAYDFPRRNDGWAFKIMKNGNYTYNSNPRNKVLPSESAAGACILVSKTVYNAIHFEDERWMESFGYPLGEDTLFSYKIYLYGYKLYIGYDMGIKHLDAGAGSKTLPKDWIRNNMALSVVIPHRLVFGKEGASYLERVECVCSCLMKLFEQGIITVLYAFFKEKRVVIKDIFKGLIDGVKYVHSPEYQEIPKYNHYAKQTL